MRKLGTNKSTNTQTNEPTDQQKWLPVEVTASPKNSKKYHYEMHFLEALLQERINLFEASKYRLSDSKS